MSSLSNLQLFTLVSCVFFIVILAVRTIKIIRTPLHLRWELMPIPHEKGRYYYGGSRYEEIDHWKKPAEKSSLTELKAMIEEIVFIKSLFKRNRQLWWFSYPFHTGLYFLICYLFLLVTGAIAENNGVTIAADSGIFGTIVHYLTVFCGFSGLILGITGAAGLLVKRITRKELRLYSAPADYFNLVFFLIVMITGFIVWMTGDRSFTMARSYIAGIFSLTPVNSMNAAMMLHIFFAGTLLIYLPFTHMIHFMAKYFAYHHVRWADEPNISGSRVEKRVIKQLGYKLKWSASHVKQGGTWADAAKDTERDANGKNN